MIPRLFYGDVKLDEANLRAQKQAWDEDVPPVTHEDTAKFLVELQLKAYEESLDSYRNATKHFDTIIVFAGASVTWLAAFIAETPDCYARLAAVLATVAFGLAIAVAFLGRRAIARPALVDGVEALRAAVGMDLRGVQDWMIRTLHVNRESFRVVVDHQARSANIATFFALGGVALAVVGAVMRPAGVAP